MSPRSTASALLLSSLLVSDALLACSSGNDRSVGAIDGRDTIDTPEGNVGDEDGLPGTDEAGSEDAADGNGTGHGNGTQDSASGTGNDSGDAAPADASDGATLCYAEGCSEDAPQLSAEGCPETPPEFGSSCDLPNGAPCFYCDPGEPFIPLRMTIDAIVCDQGTWAEEELANACD